MLTLKTSVAIVCLLGAVALSSGITYFLTVTPVTSVECKLPYPRYQGSQSPPDIPTNNGRGYGRF